MFKIPRLFKSRKKQLLALVVIISAVIFFNFIAPQSKANLNYDQNKFKIAFDIRGRDQAAFNLIIEKLGLERSISQGIEFELDSTSSAKLAARTPASASLDISKNTISFSGSLKRNLNPELDFENVKIPTSASIAVLSPDFKNFLIKNLNPPEQFASWIEKNVTSSKAQNLIIFGANNSFAVIFQNKDINLADLKNLKSPGDEPIVKEETADQTTFSLVNITKDKENIPTIFTFDKWNYLVSSPGAAKELFEQTKSAQNLVDFPSITGTQKPSLVIEYASESQDQSNLDLLLSTSQKSPVLEKISRLKFVLKGGSFSGSFSVK